MANGFSAYLLLLAAALQPPPPKLITGRLDDQLVAEGMTQIELTLSNDRDLPGVKDGDLVFRVWTPQFRPAGVPQGLAVALVETTGGAFLYIDANLDGRLAESERLAYGSGTDYGAAGHLSVPITLRVRGAPILPFKCKVVTGQRGAQPRRYLHFTASFRAEGHADIDGNRTLVSLPFNSMQGTVDFRSGLIGIDVNGDGRIELFPGSSPEGLLARGDRVILRVAERYVSVESADFASRSLVLREHASEEYTYIEVRPGTPVPDFEFTDFDGRARRLSEFRGKYVLLDFWGSWCGPCVVDIPAMKAAYERFRGRDFEILGIDFEHSATSDKVRALLAEKSVTWPNATPESVKDLVENRFRIWGFPTLILLDPEGVIVESRSSVLRGQALIPTLERVLSAR